MTSAQRKATSTAIMKTHRSIRDVFKEFEDERNQTTAGIQPGRVVSPVVTEHSATGISGPYPAPATAEPDRGRSPSVKSVANSRATSAPPPAERDSPRSLRGGHVHEGPGAFAQWYSHSMSRDNRTNEAPSQAPAPAPAPEGGSYQHGSAERGTAAEPPSLEPDRRSTGAAGKDPT